MGGQFGSMNAETTEKTNKKKRAYWDSDRSSDVKSEFGLRSSERNKNSVWMTNDDRETLVLKPDIQNFEKDGYHKGRLKGLFPKNRKGKIHICRLLENRTY